LWRAGRRASPACTAATASVLDRRLYGTRSGAILQELLTNTAHYPLANVALVLILKQTFDEAVGLDVLFMFVAAIIQAYALGCWACQGRPHPFLGNFIGPFVFTILSLIWLDEGVLWEMNHIGYWIYSAAFALLRGLRPYVDGWLTETLIVLDAVTRASIPLVMYWMFEVYLDRHFSTFAGFFSNYSHVYVSIVIPALGLLVGAARVAQHRSLEQLQETALRLRTLSEWGWGASRVGEAVAEPESLMLGRRTRVVLFMDIRGFTAWSEAHPPSEVATMLEHYYTAAEEVWSRHPTLTAKLSADEVMLVFATSADAVRAATELGVHIREALADDGLQVGIGINGGAVVEGLIGSPQRKAYEVIGDPVNLAKRLCDAAQPGEILVSDAIVDDLGDSFEVERSFRLRAKGKQALIGVHSVRRPDRGTADSREQVGCPALPSGDGLGEHHRVA
jgi:class 3 adenylate cyclase